MLVQEAHGTSLPDSETPSQSQVSTLSVSPTLPKADYVTPKTVKQWLSSGKRITLIDVRKPKEYEAGHLPDAINIPYDEVEGRAGEWDKQTPLVFYCISSSWRAPYSANLLKDLGFKKVYILEGGIVGWKAGGETLKTSQGTSPKILPYPKDLKIALTHPQDKPLTKTVLLTPEELKQFDGREGRPAYVAVEGRIYDVTQSRLWRGGVHDPSEGKALAGRDLTDVILKSPHGIQELTKFPVVGELVNEQ